ncbi:hypothetical protein SESBI_14576 [Sesbania bispinosa]|nr:hypothetical protein SESBI_14576 [Sesbania bispinosa]
MSSTPKKRKPPPPSPQPQGRLTRSSARMAALSSMRVTRSTAREASASVSGSVLFTGDELPTTKRTKKQDQGSPSNNITTIIIEHCTQSELFATRAAEAKEGLENSIPGITITVNPKKPRKGCFEIRKKGGEKYISLEKMKHPFQAMMDLEMDKLISEITDKINGQNIET